MQKDETALGSDTNEGDAYFASRLRKPRPLIAQPQPSSILLAYAYEAEANGTQWCSDPSGFGRRGDMAMVSAFSLNFLHIQDAICQGLYPLS